MIGTDRARRSRGAVTGFLVPSGLLVWGALYLAGVIDVPERGWIGALFVVGAAAGVVLHVLRLRRVRLDRGQQ